jgi:hypothetical protein
MFPYKVAKIPSRRERIKPKRPSILVNKLLAMSPICTLRLSTTLARTVIAPVRIYVVRHQNPRRRLAKVAMLTWLTSPGD